MTQTTKHTFTPGPWEIRKTKYQTIEILAKSIIIAEVYGTKTIKHSIPNASLIAASPSLLEACKAVMDARDETLIDVDSKLYHALYLCDQAILRAEGG